MNLADSLGSDRSKTAVDTGSDQAAGGAAPVAGDNGTSGPPEKTGAEKTERDRIGGQRNRGRRGRGRRGKRRPGMPRPGMISF